LFFLCFSIVSRSDTIIERSVTAIGGQYQTGESYSMTAGIMLVILGLIVVAGILYGTYKLISLLPRDD
jgi:hypothetical protein